MRRFLSALLLLVASAAGAATLKWNDTLRDVYLNGELVRNGQTLVTETKLFAWIPPAGDAMIFDRNNHEVFTADRNLFTFAADRTSATTEGELPRKDAKPFTMPDETTYLTTSLLIHAHVSHVGPMSEDDLWTTAPVWHAIHDHYTPDAKVVARLRDEQRPVTLKIVFATWCGDSKKAVPRLLKALHEAANPKLRVELFGIGNDFHSPMETIRADRITNVPTVIVTRGAIELGRAVETPATDTIESDVAAILDGNLPPHPGRYERKSLITKGKYQLRDANGARGTEDFEIWSTEEGGLLVKSTIENGHVVIETFAALDEKRQPDFAEVTRRSGTHVVRTRAYASNGKWVVGVRGDESGISEQYTVMPTMLVTPATATLGWPLFCAGFFKCDPLATYLIDDEPMGKVVTMRSTTNGEFVPLRSVRSPSIRIESGSTHYVIEPTSALNLPKRVRFADGSERLLVETIGDLPRALPAAPHGE